MKTARWALLLVMLGTAAHGAEVYRSKDANGVVSYSDRPEGANSQQVYVATQSAGRPGNTVTSPAARKAAAEQQQQQANAAKPGDAAGAGQDKPVQTPAEKAAERKKNCEIARQRQQSYTTSHRLYRTKADGEREYLNDGEIDEAKARAAADVGTWCS